MILAFILVRALANRLALARRRRAWLRELDSLGQRFNPEQQPREYLAALNALFRAVALKAFPGTHCARLQGEEWVGFIVSLMPDDTSTAGLDALAAGPYQAVPDFDESALGERARTWVKLYG